MVDNQPNSYIQKLFLWNVNGLKQHESDFPGPAVTKSCTTATFASLQPLRGRLGLSYRIVFF